MKTFFHKFCKAEKFPDQIIKERNKSFLEHLLFLCNLIVPVKFNFILLSSRLESLATLCHVIFVAESKIVITWLHTKSHAIQPAIFNSCLFFNVTGNYRHLIGWKRFASQFIKLIKIKTDNWSEKLNPMKVRNVERSRRC